MVMPQINKSALVAFSSHVMYQLVNDVAAYPEFVRGCEKAEVLEQSEHHMKARLYIAQAGISQSFTTENHLIPDREIQMQLIDGPFEYLTGVWRFHELAADACKVEFYLDFKFNNPLLGMAFGKVFQSVAESMMQAFIERAKKVYG
jgi:ribosome-associated toxin RatA of RatAB toxin-antitoxin module